MEEAIEIIADEKSEEENPKTCKARATNPNVRRQPMKRPNVCPPSNPTSKCAVA